MDQFREGRRGFQVKTECGIPVWERAERKPVSGTGGDLPLGVVGTVLGGWTVELGGM
jgi:hypothetical protein